MDSTERKIKVATIFALMAFSLAAGLSALLVMYFLGLYL
jgi:hypothetical protein